MALATLTTTGRAAIARAIMARPLHLAWGTGDEAWDEPGAALPSLVEATALRAEIGRRAIATRGFVTPDAQGGIVIPVGQRPDGSAKNLISVPPPRGRLISLKFIKLRPDRFFKISSSVENKR